MGREGAQTQAELQGTQKMGLSCYSGLWHQFPVNPVRSRVERGWVPGEMGEGARAAGAACSLAPSGALPTGASSVCPRQLTYFS